MKKAGKLLKMCEQELRTSIDGEIPHSHEEIFDEEGILIDLGPADNGPKHKHPIEKDEDGKVTIGSADNHVHMPSGEKPPVKGALTDLEKDQAGVEKDVASTEDNPEA